MIRVLILCCLFLLAPLLAPQLVLSEAGVPAQSVPVHINRVLLINDAPAVELVDRPGKKFLWVFIDHFMASAIHLGMEAPVLERPLTHDLIGILLTRLEAKVNRIDITELKNNTYYALITIEVNGMSHQIDARPSDALAIAVRKKSPIFVHNGLLKQIRKPKERATPRPGGSRKGRAST